MLVMGIFAAAFAMYQCAKALTNKRAHMGFLSIGIDYFQVLGMLARSKARWPPELKALMRYLSIFNLNVEIAAPECAMPTWR